MSEHTIELTRRKLLAGAGVLGAAGAGAGMGTSALFGDEESYAGNEIRAGELNLMVDLATVTESAVTTNVDYRPFATGPQ